MLTTREVIKTFYNALLQRLKKHRGDWNQNDPSADDYIKNRPFYTDETKKIVNVPEQKITIPSKRPYTAWLILPEPIEFIVGQTYEVKWDDKTYSCVAFDLNGISAIGNRVLFDDGTGTDTGEPFIIMISKAEGFGRVFAPEAIGTHTVEVTTTKVVKLDKKYLPDLGLAPVATSGSYNDLEDTPTLVKTVNGIEPDDTGNVAVEIPAGGVQTVNGVAPDENGNVNVVYKNIDETVHIPIPTDWSMADEWDKADVSLTSTPDYIYKVSDEVPELTYVKTVKETIRMFGGEDITYVYSEESKTCPIHRGDGIMWAGYVAMAARAGELTFYNTVTEQNVTYSYPSAGIYIDYDPQDDTGLKSASYHLCTEKIGIYLNSLSGKEFMITVDDSGTLTAEAVTE